MLEPLYTQAKALLHRLIETPSLSREEDRTADLIQDTLRSLKIVTHRSNNNVWAFNRYYDPSKPTLLLNSHHDTVRPNESYTRSPYFAHEEDGKLYGLGTNDAGASLVGLLAAFLHFYDHKKLPFNLIFSATAEEEISGSLGVESILDKLPDIWAAIVGEPTDMQMAIAEKGLLVVDAVAQGIAGHAARDEGENAIYLALEDIQRIRNHTFSKKSPTLGSVHMTVTMIQAGSQHNVVPDQCQFTIDIRVTDAYTHEEILSELSSLCTAGLQARSTRLRSSGLPTDHIFHSMAQELDISTYGSPTLSDQALMPWPSIKMGIGHSGRSHTADEYIFLSELKQGIEGYTRFLDLLIAKMNL